MIKVVEDVGDQCPSLIISVWAPECWVYVYIIYEYIILRINEVVCAIYYALSDVPLWDDDASRGGMYNLETVMCL